MLAFLLACALRARRAQRSRRRACPPLRLSRPRRAAAPLRARAPPRASRASRCEAAADGRAPPRGATARERWLARAERGWPTLLIAGVLCFVAFVAGGGLNLSDMTTVEIALTLGAARDRRTARAARRRPACAPTALWPLGLLLAFTALTALSVVWSVQPDDSCRTPGACSPTAPCSAPRSCSRARLPDALAGGARRRRAGGRRRVRLRAADEGLPRRLDASDIYARLRAPYSYWNAIGLTAAMGAIGCMWLGARRAGHALLSALAYPAMGLMLLTLMLAYSRGALVALVLGLALWFCIVPLRLRGAAVLITARCWRRRGRRPGTSPRTR